MTTDSMVEKMARAIGEHYDGYCDPVATPNTWASAMGAARAALKVMREPTERVVEAMQTEVNLLDNPDPPNAVEFLARQEVLDIWSAAIDAALKEGE